MYIIQLNLHVSFNNMVDRAYVTNHVVIEVPRLPFDGETLGSDS